MNGGRVHRTSKIYFIANDSYLDAEVIGKIVQKIWTNNNNKIKNNIIQKTME